MMQEELVLLHRGRSLEQEALTAIHNSYYPGIYRYITFRVDDRYTAEDLTSEVFLRLLKALRDHTAPQKTLRGWLYGVASKVVKDYYRQTKRANLMVLFIVVASFMTASTSALPGDALYGAKRLYEEIRLTRAGDSGEIESLREQTQGERIREVEAILQTDRDVAVEFEGPINVIQTDSWRIGDIQVQVDKFTRVVGAPRNGVWVLGNDICL